MTTGIPKVKHLVLEIRYKPSLAFYGAMDKIGLAFSSDYPDWERSALTLEIRDKKHKRRAVLSHQRTFFEAIDFADPFAEFDRAQKLFDKLHHELAFTQLKRIGIRQWAYIVVEEKFERLVKNMASKLHSPEEALANALHGTLDDIMYAAHIRADAGWKYHLKMGPMKQKQWFEIIPYEKNLFPTEESFKEFKESIPETMVFIDIDGFQEETPYSDLSSVMPTIRRGVETVYSDLARYVMG